MAGRFKNVGALERWLAREGIDTSSWDGRRAKQVGALFAELERGECTLQENPPLRLVTVLQLHIRKKGAVLLEIEQELGSGRRRKRNRPPSEKMKPGESTSEAAIRCLEEELGVDGDSVRLIGGEESEEYTADSPSYPGLSSHYTIYGVEAAVNGLPDEDFWRENSAYGEGDPVTGHRWGWRPDK